MKSNTSVSIDEAVLNRVKAVAKAAGETTSVFLERAARHELMYLAGQAVTEYEQRQAVGVEDRALVDLEMQEHIAAAYGRKAG